MSLERTTAYINAGGQGTRLQGVFAPESERNGIAKALLEVGSPRLKLVDHHITSLSNAGVGTIVVGAAHQRSVATHVRESYRQRPDIQVATTERQLGTAGELIAACTLHPAWFSDRIFICNVDTILDISVSRLERFHRAAGTAMSIALTSNRGVPNQDAFYMDENRHVLFSAEAPKNRMSLEDAERQAAYRGSSTGAIIVETDFMRSLGDAQPESGEFSLYRQAMGAALLQGAVAGYDNGDNFFIDVGTVQTWTLAQETNLLQPYLAYPSSR